MRAGQAHVVSKAFYPRTEDVLLRFRANWTTAAVSEDDYGDVADEALALPVVWLVGASCA